MRNILEFDFQPSRRRRRAAPRRSEPTKPSPVQLAETGLPLTVINRLEARGIITVDALGDVPDDIIHEILKSGARTQEQVYELLVTHGRRLSRDEITAMRAAAMSQPTAKRRHVKRAERPSRVTPTQVTPTQPSTDAPTQTSSGAPTHS